MCFVFDPHYKWRGGKKCLVPIYVSPEMKLLFPKQNYNVLSLSSYTHISVRDINISRIGLPILLQGKMRTDPGNMYKNRSQTHECGNWDWGRAIPRKGIHKCDFPCSAALWFIRFIIRSTNWSWNRKFMSGFLNPLVAFLGLPVTTLCLPYITNMYRKKYPKS